MGEELKPSQEYANWKAPETANKPEQNVEKENRLANLSSAEKSAKHATALYNEGQGEMHEYQQRYEAHGNEPSSRTLALLIRETQKDVDAYKSLEYQYGHEGRSMLDSVNYQNLSRVAKNVELAASLSSKAAVAKAEVVITTAVLECVAPKIENSLKGSNTENMTKAVPTIVDTVKEMMKTRVSDLETREFTPSSNDPKKTIRELTTWMEQFVDKKITTRWSGEETGMRLEEMNRAADKILDVLVEANRVSNSPLDPERYRAGLLKST